MQNVLEKLTLHTPLTVLLPVDPQLSSELWGPASIATEVSADFSKVSLAVDLIRKGPGVYGEESVLTITYSCELASLNPTKRHAAA
ncbi:hypothetical protein Y1Q_0009126 [Alligator mississippiensis]|uniref:Uncharacterized protein n=1 Tax=Alligator mississippiensis TaxID=8496 RepID=A0A151M2J2_ALLMI|nr:hypothetical protein Y1Q_0009126 [Alligator mississippiensis]